MEMKARKTSSRLRFGLALRLALGLLPVGMAACWVPLEEGQRMQQQISLLQQGSQQSRQELSQKLQRQSEELNKLLDEARRLTSSLADSSQKSDKLQNELIQFQGRLEETQRSLEALQKQFGEFRAHSDTQLEQLTNSIATIKNPPLPETPDALFNEAERKLVTREFNEARRRYEAFLNRFATDPRAPKAQLNIGESYFQESKYANALIALRKVIDNYPKSDEVEAALYKSGQAFFVIKKCNEARTFFQELLRLYPRTRLKNDVNDQLKELTRSAKNKATCET
jgi:TolA-binding protein